MQGILLVDKPSDWTSFDVVNYVRKTVAAVEGKKPKNCKVGHTGTLDPLATGLLVLLVGKDYTRRAGDMSKHDKTYEVQMKLGFTSTTGDSEGLITPFASGTDPDAKGAATEVFARFDLANGRVGVPSDDAIKAVMERFLRQIMQTPPAYSAIKINGQKAYELARKGREVKLEPRPVTIYDIRDVVCDYPYITFTCDVSSGTYIRSLVEDIGRELGTGAYMTALRRTRVGEYDLKDAVPPVEISESTLLAQLFEI